MFDDMLTSFIKMTAAAAPVPEPFKEIPETTRTDFVNPSVERDMHNGTQKLWRFANGYGASVVRHFGSYGGDNGLWELAVIKFNAEGTWALTYDTAITSDVIGHLDEKEVEALLMQIKSLEVEA